jgi:hypothetical protein
MSSAQGACAQALARMQRPLPDKGTLIRPRVLQAVEGAENRGMSLAQLHQIHVHLNLIALWPGFLYFLSF